MAKCADLYRGRLSGRDHGLDFRFRGPLTVPTHVWFDRTCGRVWWGVVEWGDGGSQIFTSSQQKNLHAYNSIFYK